MRLLLWKWLVLLVLLDALCGCAAVADLAVSGVATWNGLRKSAPETYQLHGEGQAREFLALAEVTGKEMGATAKYETGDLVLSWKKQGVAIQFNVEAGTDQFDGVAMSSALDDMTWAVSDPVRAVPPQFFAKLSSAVPAQMNFRWEQKNNMNT